MIRERTKISGDVVHLIREPGNATRYEAIAVNIGNLQDHGGQWLVTFPMIQAGYTFNQGSFVAPEYVEEKLNGAKRATNVDIHEMCKMIAEIVGGTHGAKTDNSGHFPGGHLSLAR